MSNASNLNDCGIVQIDCNKDQYFSTEAALGQRMVGFSNGASVPWITAPVVNVVGFNCLGALTVAGTESADTAYPGGTLNFAALDGDDSLDPGTEDASVQRVCGGDGDDSVYGRGGNDHIAGGGGADTIFAGTGNDTVYDGPGVNNLTGGSGTDTIVRCDDGVSDSETGFELSVNAGACYPGNWDSVPETLNYEGFKLVP